MTLQGRKDGSATIEYIIILPLVIFIIFFIIFLGFMYYQQALIHSTISESIENASFLMGYSLDKTELDIGIISKDAYNSKKLYWHLNPLNSKNEEVLKFAIINQIKEQSILKTNKDIEVEIDYVNYLVVKELTVKVTCYYSFPAKGLFRLVGVNEYFPVTAKEAISIRDPKEFMQNTDYIIQIYNESGAYKWVKEKCEPLVNAIKNIKDEVLK